MALETFCFVFLLLEECRFNRAKVKWFFLNVNVVIRAAVRATCSGHLVGDLVLVEAGINETFRGLP